MQFRDWFNVGTLTAPLGVLFAFGFGFFAGPVMSMTDEILWMVGALIVASLTWWSTAQSATNNRLSNSRDLDIKEKLGSLVDVASGEPASKVLGAAAAKILDLEKQLRDIQHGIPRTITAEQWDAMSSILRALPSPPPLPHIIVVFREEYFETARYAREFVRLFQYHSIGGGMLTNPVPPLTADVNGLVLRYDNTQEKAEIITRVSQALTVAHIDHREEAVALPLDLRRHCELVVGKSE